MLDRLRLTLCVCLPVLFIGAIAAWAKTSAKTVSLLWVKAGIAKTVYQGAAKQDPIATRLINELKSKNVDVRRNAASDLGSMRARPSVRALISSLLDPSAQVREAAAFALGQIADPVAAPHLLKSLTDKDSEVRASSAFALGMLGDRKATSQLSNALDDSDAGVRSSAIIALGLMQDEEAIEEVADMLNDASFDVRFDAVWTLGQIGEPDVVDSLKATLPAMDLVRVDDLSKAAFREAVQISIEQIEQREALGNKNIRPRRAGDGIVSETARRVSHPPSISESVRPASTERASLAKIAGGVGVKVLVAADGRAARVYVVKRLGSGLDQRAVEAVLNYRFKASVKDGLPQTEWMNLEIQFPAK